ncbi:lysylphosphatidylglycerol synthetase-like protein (DUF2156 family) [Nonomuraea thailandensis]|uniref:Lysylphosphatidylglycerol synthetase-like protein (DUF2156 family) n=1 Tax=Nonomuraea thailandensis TaxID=1188745 RepID=A0A9X2GPF0_9ACTN|nr:hypothetical protein [Nonomuraea thailandensis]MCP2363074.1 lysylphosphatidylglycerol synthetase-like protein (DUF2156 family) [Nonomuraea thailandensis]
MSQPYGPQGQEPPLPPYAASQPVPGQLYAPQGHAYSPPAPPAPARSQALAIIALVLGVLAILIALTPFRFAAMPLAVFAAVLAIVALAVKSQGGTAYAAVGLACAAVGLVLAILLAMASTTLEQNNLRQQQQMQDCVSDPDRSAEEMLRCINGT